MKNNSKNKLDYDLTELSKHSSAVNDFDMIDTKADWQLVRKKIESGKKNIPINKNKKNINLFIKIAAVFLLIIGLGVVFKNYQKFGATPEIIVVKTLHEKKEIILADKSKVTLNVNSELAYPEHFAKNSRVVGLKGEAFFEIEKNKSKPFIVETGKVSTKVLGTSFTLNAKDDIVEINVVSGKVEFFNTEKPSSKIILIKNQKADFVSGNIIKKENTDPNFLSWKTGILTFKNTPLKMVFLTLEKHFYKKIKIENELNLNSTLTTTFKNEVIENVFDELSIVTNFEYKIKMDTVYISKTKK